MNRLPRGGKVLLFLSSYTPLYLIFIARLWDYEKPIIGVSIPVLHFGGFAVSSIVLIPVLLSTFGIGYLIAILWIRRSRQGQLETFKHHENKSELFSEYLLVYIFPLVVMEFNDFGDIFSFGLFFVLVGVIAIRSNRLYTNPMLAVFGYDIYRVETEHDNYLLLSNKQLEGDSVSMNTATISNGVHIVTN